MLVLVKYFIGLLFIFTAFRSYSDNALTRVIINGKVSAVSGKTIHLKAADKDLILEFGASHSDSVLYLYKLSGVDRTWIKSAFPATRYQNLDGGSYLFEIRTLIKNRVSDSVKIQIIKDNVFWNEVWFIPSIVAYALVLIGVGIYLFFLYDFRQKLKMQSVRNQIASDLHDEVGSNLNSIAIFVEVLRKNAPSDMLPILEKIIANSRESVSLMQDTVWTINPKNDSIAKLFERMNSFASQVLSSKDIAFDFDVQPDLMKANFSMEQRKNLYLIFKEAINNIVKHAYATKVTVTITSSKDQMEILIEDNGQGFDTSEEFQGNGLYNFKERADEAEIDLLIESKLKAGTKVSMKIAG